MEIDRVFEAADRFLANDTRRVSGVIVTSIGAINYGPNQSVTDGPVRLRTASRSWLIRNPAPYIELPHGFDAPPFDRPEVRVQASSSKMGESGLTTRCSRKLIVVTPGLQNRRSVRVSLDHVEQG